MIFLNTLHQKDKTLLNEFESEQLRRRKKGNLTKKILLTRTVVMYLLPPNHVSHV